MAEDRIDDIVSPKALKQLDDLDAKLVATQRQLVDNLEAAIKFNSALSGSKSLKDLDTSYQKAAKSMENLNKAFEKERLSKIRLEQAREKAFDKYEKQLKAQEAAQLKANAAAEKAASPYNQLAAALAKAEKEALDLGATFGNNSREFLDAAKNVQVLRQQVDSLEQPLGRFQRNVGNYRSGFSGLGNSINQLTREFPAFTFSVQTGFLALSNNLPIFFDEIQRTNKEIATLRSQGEKVPGLFKQLAASFFSFGTLLSIGITLLTLYGKEIGEFFSALFNGKQSMDAFVLRQKALNESIKESNFSDASKNVIELTQNIDLAKKGYISSEGVVKQFNETIGKTVGSVSSLAEAEQKLNELAPEYIKFTFLKAAAETAAGLAAEKAAEIQREKLKDDEEYLTLYEKFLQKIPTLAKNADEFDKGIAKAAETRRSQRISDLTKEQESFVTVFSDFQKQAAEISKKLNFDFFGDGDKEKLKDSSLELQKQLLIGLKQSTDLIVENESTILNERLKAAEKSIQLAKDIAAIEKNQAIKNGDDKKLAEQLFQNQIAEIILEGEKKKTEIRKQAADKELKDLEELFKLQTDAAKKADTALLDRLNANSEQRQLIATNEADAALLEVARQYSEGQIKAEEYAQKRLDIQSQLARDLVNEEIKNIQVIIDLQKAAGQDTADQEKKLAELKQRLSKETTSKQISDLEKLAEREKELNEKKVELAYAVRDLGIAIIQGNFEQARESLIQESEQIDIRKAKEIEAAQRSILTEQQKADRIAIINAQAQSQKEALERRQRQIDLSRARFERAANIANIIGSTAAAVAKALPNIPLSILVGAIGAVQLATAVAAPLPRFEKGGKMKYTGLAEYGHGTELRIDPDGKVSLTKSTPEVGLVKAGTQFISNKDLARLMAKPDQIAYAGGQTIDLKEVIAATDKSRKDIVSAIKSNKSGYGGISFYSTAKGRSYLSRNL